MKYKNIVTLIDRYQTKLEKLRETDSANDERNRLAGKIKSLKEQWTLDIEKTN